MVKVGDKVRRKPQTFSSIVDEISSHTKLKTEHVGKVIYVHPKGRFHVVEFGAGEWAVRESFSGV